MNNEHGINKNPKREYQFLAGTETLNLKNSSENRVKIEEISYPIIEKQEISSSKKRILPDLENCPFSSEEIAKHSFLDTLSLPVVNLDNEIFLKFVGNFLSAGLGPHDLEGFDPRFGYMIFEELFEDLKTSLPKTKEFNSLFEVVLELQCKMKELKEMSKELALVSAGKNNILSLAEKWTKKIVDVPVGESVWMQGGWNKEENQDGKVDAGHSLVYKFTKSSQGYYDIDVYEGQASSINGLGYLCGDKSKVIPVTCYRNVPFETLFLSQKPSSVSNFIQRLLEICIADNVISPEKELEKTFKDLEEFRVKVRSDQYGLMTGQRSGSCMISTVKALLQVETIRMKDLATFKQIIFHLKIRALIKAYHHLENDLSENKKNGEMTRNALTYGARNLLGTIDKLLQGVHGYGCLLEPQFAEKAQATLYEILKKIDVAEKKIQENRRLQRTPSDLFESSKALKIKDLQQKQQKQRKQKISSAGVIPLVFRDLSPEKVSHLIKKNPAPSTAKEFKDQAANLIERYKSCSKDYEKSSFCFELARLLDQLPLPGDDDVKKFWKGSPQDLEDYMEHLASLMKKYGELNWQKETSSRTHTTVMTAHALIHYLALEIDKKKSNFLNRFNPPVYIDYLLKQEGLLFFEKNELDRLCKIEKYRQSSSGKTFNDEEGKNQNQRGFDSYPFWSKFLEYHQSLYEPLDEEAKIRWRDLTKKELQQAFERRFNEWERSRRKCHKLWEVNLSTEKKRQLVLVEAAFLENNVLKREGYGYINILRNNLYFTRHYILKGLPRNLGSFTAERELFSEYSSGEFSLKVRNAREDLDGQFREIKTSPKNISLDYRHVNDEFFNDPVFGREKDDFQDIEGSILKENSSPLFKQMKRIASGGNITPHQLIYLFKRYRNDLKDPSIQMIFFRLFFRSLFSLKDVEPNGGEMIVKHEKLRQEAFRFIKKGISDFRNQGKQGVDGVRFFLEFGFYISKSLLDNEMFEEAAKFDKVAFINDCLLDKKICDPKTLSVFHRYRFLFLSLKPPEKLKEEEFVDLCESWIYDQRVPDDDKWKSQAILNIKQDYLFQVLSYLNENKEKFSTLAPKLLCKLGYFNSIDGLHGNLDMNVFEVIAENKEKWSLNLLTGELYAPSQKFGCLPLDYPWKNQENFKRAFASHSDFDYQLLGENDCTFKISDVGAFRLIRHENQYELERQFSPNGPWFRYQDPKLWGEVFPGILSKDLGFWKLVCKDTSEAVGYLVDLKTHRARYKLDFNGVITECEEEENLHARVIETLPQTQNEQETFFVKAFENPENILTLRDQKSNEIQSLQFGRYMSMEGRALEFIKKNDRLVWKENTQYFIPKEMPKGYLENFPDYLFLQSSDEKLPNKILVPCKIVKYNQLDEAVNFDENKREGWGTVSYVAYDIVEDQLSPTSLEGRIYLAYLYLSQKKYSLAMMELRKIRPIDTINSRCKEILSLIQRHSLSQGHPDGNMVVLFAFLLMTRAIDKEAKENVHKYVFAENHKNDEKSHLDYICSLNHISLDCRLKQEEEVELLTKLLKSDCRYLEIVRRRLQFLRCGEQKTVSLMPEKSSSNESFCQKFSFSIPGLSGYSPDPYASRLYNMEAKCNHEEKLGDKIAWLSEGEIAALLYPMAIIEKNGRLLFEVFRIAKKEDNLSERREMVYKLGVWKNRADNKDEIDLMMAILIDPQNFPQPVDLKATTSVKGQFLIHLENAYNKSPLDLKKILGFFDRKVSSHKELEVQKKVPILDRSVFYPTEKPKLLSRPFPQFLKKTMPDSVTRSYHLIVWKNCFLKERDVQVNENQREDLFKVEEDFPATLSKDFNLYRKELETGKKQRKREKSYDIQQDKCNEFHNEVSGIRGKIGLSIVEKEKELLELANKRSTDPLKRQSEMLLIGSKVKNFLTAEDCLQMLLTHDQEEYRRQNENLTAEDIRKLIQMTLELEELKSEKLQLGRIVLLLEKISSSKDLDERASVCQMLAAELNVHSDFKSFDLEAEIALRVFSAETGMIPTQKQLMIIKKMMELSEVDKDRFKDIVIQLIMGGGKTSVIATLVLYLSARRKESLATFVVPPALFHVVKANLGDTLFSAFRKNVQSLDMRRYEYFQITTDKTTAKSGDRKERASCGQSHHGAERRS